MKKKELETFDENRYFLVDIREEDEVERLPVHEKATHIPMSRLPEALAKGNLPHDKTIVTICMSGGRCHTVNGFLEANGFRTDLLEGGMLGL